MSGLNATVWSDDSSQLVDQIPKTGGRVILRGTLSRQPMAAMLSRYVEAELRRANQRDRDAWNAVKTGADWERMRERRLAALRSSLAHFPEVPEDLKVRVVGTTSGDGFHVDNLVFESRPGVIVTANLYRPSKPSAKMPGLIICHSHLRPKETGARQLMGATWARAGFGGFNVGKGGGGCACWHARFALDYFGRSFAPEVDHFTVAVLDSAGNLIMRVGRYGNVDDGVPLVKNSAVKPRSIGGDETALFHAAYVATQTDSRLFVADAGNARIVSVKLGYHTPASVPLQKGATAR